jgi:LuxR family maltose regulon positive regulatory protein
MPRAPSPLAKLSRPRLHGAIPRERLFERLDALQHQAVTLLAAPPGAGKTTLVASYLDSRKIGGIWFQFDEGDRDPATFFYYLGIAASMLPSGSKGRSRLPLLTPEYSGDLPGFARRYFRDLFSRMSSPCAVVFDNFQEIGDDGPLHTMLSAALEEIPAGARVILISRHPPPDQYVRLAANRTMGMIGWEDVRLTNEEVTGLLGAVDLALSPDTIRTLQQNCGGWAAGLLLLTEQLRRGRQLAAIPSAESLAQVFAYFAGQFFDDLAPGERRALVRMSYLPAVSERMAREITGDETAGALLARLYRRHLFTDLRNAEESSYAFHGLFRSFLQHRAGSELTAAESRATAQRAGELLQAAREFQEAMVLLMAAGDLSSAQALACGEAAALIGQGRWKVVVDWIEALPPDCTASSPWLLYWLGTAWSGVDPARARRHLEEAHRVARQRDDQECAVMSAAGMIDSYFLEYVDFNPLTPWITEVDRMFAPDFRFTSVESELRALSAMIVGCTYREPDHPHLDQSAKRLGELLADHPAIDVNLKVTCGTDLMLYGAFTSHLDAALRASILTVPLLSDPAVHLFRRMFGWAVTLWYATCASDHVLGDRATASLMEMARDDGLHIAERFACILGYYLDMDRQDWTAGMRRIERFEGILMPSQPYEVASLANMKAWHGVYTGDVPLARRHAAEAVSLFEAAGSIPHTINAYLAYLWSSLESGDMTAAGEAVRKLSLMASGRNMHWGSWGVDAAGAIRALRGGDEAGLLSALERLFGQPRDAGDYYAHQFSWCSTWATSLAVAALERGVWTDNVRRFARTFRLPSPDPTVTNWPWPVRITTLGRFEISLDGIPVGFSGRAPHRTLLLLKALISLGGTGVKDYLLIDALWPDEEGDVARDAFRVALHRLRKLLAHPDTILVDDGRISLNLDKCWVDAIAFERILDTEHADERALRLYGGDFLQSDDTEPWSATFRDRLKRKFLRRVQDIGEMHEGEGRHTEAATLYSRAMETDPTAEAVVCGYMRCHRQTGGLSAAIAAYERLNQALHATYGIQPGEHARRLYEDIRAETLKGRHPT